MAADMSPGGPLGRQRGHQLAGLVHLGVGGHLALIQVGRERGEALRGEQVANRLDLGHQPPPFLQHDHARARAPIRSRHIATCRRSVGGELHHLTHGCLLSGPIPVRVCVGKPARFTAAVPTPGVARRYAQPVAGTSRMLTGSTASRSPSKV